MREAAFGLLVYTTIISAAKPEGEWACTAIDKFANKQISILYLFSPLHGSSTAVNQTRLGSNILCILKHTLIQPCQLPIHFQCRILEAPGTIPSQCLFLVGNHICSFSLSLIQCVSSPDANGHSWFSSFPIHGMSSRIYFLSLDVSNEEAKPAQP